jgi:hypothetical protein
MKMNNYNPIPRGKCPLCKDYVWSDQYRNKDLDGVYRHIRCPRRISGTIKDIETLNRTLAIRANNYDMMPKPNHKFGSDTRERHLLTGFKLYLSLPVPRAPIEIYRCKKEETFMWTLSKLHNELAKHKQ